MQKNNLKEMIHILFFRKRNEVVVKLGNEQLEQIEYIIDDNKYSKIYCIDSWMNESEYKEYIQKNNLTKYTDRIIPMYRSTGRKFFEEGVKELKDNKIFIDVVLADCSIYNNIKEHIHMLYNEFPHTMIAGYNLQEDSVSEDIRQCEKDFNKTLLCIGTGKELTGWYYQPKWSKEYEVKLGMDGINKHMDGSVPQLVVHLLYTDFYKELTLKIKED